jgi:hypothetical protein
MVRQKSVQAGSFASGSELDVKSSASETRAGTQPLWSGLMQLARSSLIENDPFEGSMNN